MGAILLTHFTDQDSLFKLWVELGNVTQIITYDFTILICLKKQVRNPKQSQAKVLR